MWQNSPIRLLLMLSPSLLLSLKPKCPPKRSPSSLWILSRPPKPPLQSLLPKCLRLLLNLPPSSLKPFMWPCCP